MPERLQVWQSVAENYAGAATADTRLDHTRLELSFSLPTTRVVARGRSVPYGGRLAGRGGLLSLAGDRIEVEALARGSANLELDVRTDDGWIAPRMAGLERASLPFEVDLLVPHFVWSNDAALAETWLSGYAITLLNQEARVRLQIRKGRLKISGSFVPLNPGELGRLLELAKELSSERGRALEHQWYRLASKIGGRVQSLDSEAPDFDVGAAPRIDCTRSPHDLEVGTEIRSVTGSAGDRVLWTVVRCKRLGASSGSFALCPDGDSRARVGGSSVHGSVRVAGPEALVSACLAKLSPLRTGLGSKAVVLLGRDVEVLWRGFVIDPIRIEAGIAAATALAIERDAPVGPYR